MSQNLLSGETTMRLPILDKLDKELEETKVELKVDIPKALKTAMEHGDLSENAEFKAAKERQMYLETRLSQIQKRISDVMALNSVRSRSDRSGLGSTLFLKDLNTGGETQYHLVFPQEVNPDEGKISTASPVGRSLVGKQKGDEVTISLPGQQKEFEVLKITTIHENGGNL
jgi:transcription elongation factor GreA